MSLFHILIVVCITGSSWTQSYGGIETNDLNENDYEVKLFGNDEYLTMFKYITRDVEKVHIQIYYECLCPDCIQFDVDQFSPVLETMNQYLDIHTYPYGNAKTIEENGKIYFKCQHGPPECYGNKLHACALDNLQHTTALRFNVCLMNSTEGQGSDDKTADECGKSMGQDSEAIKACAKGNRGTELLKYYGEQSKKADFDHVPYVLINGKEYNTDDSDDFKKAVCAAFTVPPQPCTTI